MPKKNKYELPQSIFVYVCDHDANDNGKPILCVAESLSEIPDDSDGELIGEYSLREVGKIRVEVTIKRV